MIGFYARGSHNLVDIQICPVMFDPINQIKEDIRQVIEKHHLSIYDEWTHTGFLRNIIIRGSMTDNEFLIGFVTTPGHFQKKMVKELADINNRAKGRYKVTGIAQNINTQKNNVILGKESKILWGKGYYHHTMGMISYRLSLTSFSQINPFQAERLNCMVDKMISGKKGLILDAYCGIGNMALWLASRGRSVIGIEENAEAVKNANISAQENGINNCSFIAITVEDYFLDNKNETNFQAVILNPPRKGCAKEVIEALLKMRPEKIIYVSCHPATLARDLNMLCVDKYAIEDLIVIDMFPQTAHMETVVSLKFA
jgi:23S rRNA (uracil1939-C5)-methyltransferase